MTRPDAERACPDSSPPPEPDTDCRREASRVVRRRDPGEMTAEERAFLARHRLDAPPHHDSAWG